MTVISAYKNPDTVQQVLSQLIENGTDKTRISVGALEETSKKHFQSEKDAIEGATNATATGAMGGAALAFLVGAASIAFGSGLFLIGGPLAAVMGGSLVANTAVGAGVGALGGLFSALTQKGLDEAQGGRFEEIIGSGGAMVAIENPTEMEKRILTEGSPAETAEI